MEDAPIAVEPLTSPGNLQPEAPINRMVFARLFQESGVMNDLCRLGVNAAVGGSLALFCHDIPREKAPGDIDIHVWGSDVINLRSLLIAERPESYTITKNSLIYTDVVEQTNIQFLSTGQSSTLAWLRLLDHHVDTDKILGLKVLSLECCLLGKLSATNTRLRTILPGRRQKGEQDYKDVLAIAQEMRKRRMVYQGDLTAGAQSGFELFINSDRTLIEGVISKQPISSYEAFEIRIVALEEENKKLKSSLV